MSQNVHIMTQWKFNFGILHLAPIVGFDPMYYIEIHRNTVKPCSIETQYLFLARNLKSSAGTGSCLGWGSLLLMLLVTVCVCVCVCVCPCVHMCIHVIHTYIYTHIYSHVQFVHTHTHTHTHPPPRTRALTVCGTTPPAFIACLHTTMQGFQSSKTPKWQSSRCNFYNNLPACLGAFVCVCVCTRLLSCVRVCLTCHVYTSGAHHSWRMCTHVCSMYICLLW